MLKLCSYNGQIGGRPRASHQPNGISVTSFCVAVDRRLSRQARRERPILSNCVCMASDG